MGEKIGVRKKVPKYEHYYGRRELMSRASHLNASFSRAVEPTDLQRYTAIYTRRHAVPVHALILENENRE